MCRNFIKNQVVDLLKIRIKVLLYVEHHFNRHAALDRKISLVDFECFRAVELSCDMQEKHKSQLEPANLDAFLSGDSKAYRIEKSLDELGRRTTTISLLFSWVKVNESNASESSDSNKVYI